VARLPVKKNRVAIIQPKGNPAHKIRGLRSRNDGNTRRALCVLVSAPNIMHKLCRELTVKKGVQATTQDPPWPEPLVSSSTGTEGTSTSTLESCSEAKRAVMVWKASIVCSEGGGGEGGVRRRVERCGELGSVAELCQYLYHFTTTRKDNRDRPKLEELWWFRDLRSPKEKNRSRTIEPGTSVAS